VGCLWGQPISPRARAAGRKQRTACAATPTPPRLEPFRDLVAVNEYPSGVYLRLGGSPDDEWVIGNVSTRAVAYSCGRLTRDDRPLDHRHDPEELALCERVANEAASRLTRFRVGEGEPIRPFFAAAVVGEPVPEVLDEPLVRRAFGGTLPPGINFQIQRMGRRGGHWDQMDGLSIDLDTLPPEIESVQEIIAHQAAAWDEFADWFVGVPGLREHSVIGIGYSDADPGVLKPRLLLALTAAGSLVGVISYVTQG
jgi:hypothetical protein